MINYETDVSTKIQNYNETKKEINCDTDPKIQHYNEIKKILHTVTKL